MEARSREWRGRESRAHANRGAKSGTEKGKCRPPTSPPRARHLISELPSTPRGAIFLRPSRERDLAPRPPLTHASGARLDADEPGKDRARARAWFRTRSPVARADDERGGSEEAEEEHAFSRPHPTMSGAFKSREEHRRAQELEEARKVRPRPTRSLPSKRRCRSRATPRGRATSPRAPVRATRPRRGVVHLGFLPPAQLDPTRSDSTRTLTDRLSSFPRLPADPERALVASRLVSPPRSATRMATRSTPTSRSSWPRRRGTSRRSPA